MIEPFHLEILSHVKREKTLARAARAVHRTQPTLTHAIRKLESEIGVRLWRKQGRGIQLTPAGYHLAVRGEAILGDLNRLEDDLAAFAAGRKGTLRIGVECHPCFHWLAPAVGRFLRRRPEIDVDVLHGDRFTGYDGLRMRRIDIVVTPDPRIYTDVVSVAILPYELVLAVGRDHPLARRDHVVPSDLSLETVFTYPVDRGRLDLFSTFLIPAGIYPARVETIESTEIMMELVMAGRGVTAIPDWLLSGDTGGDIVALRIGERGIGKQLVVSYRREDADLEYLLSFIAEAKVQIGAVRKKAVR